MSKWIKKWSDDKNTYNEDEIEPNDDIHILKKKMRKMRKKHDNPKNIPIFDFYMIYHRHCYHHR